MLIHFLLMSFYCRDEIEELKMTKPNYAERRSVIHTDSKDTSESDNNNDEEKKMDDNVVTLEAESTDVAHRLKNESGSEDSTSSNKVVGSVDEGEKLKDGDAENGTENETTIDISADSISLFTRLLSISNKNGAASGTVTLSTTGAENDEGGEIGNEGEKGEFSATILQNGRPVSSILPLSFLFFCS